MRIKKSFSLLLIFVLILSLAACNTTNDEKNKEESKVEKKDSEKTKEIVVYTTRKEEFVRPILEKFAKDQEIELKLLAGDETFINRLMEEKENPQADILISNDTGALEYLRLEGVLQENDDQALEVIDEKYRAKDGSWVGLSARTRGFVYNKEKMDEKDLPQTMEELQDKKYKGNYAITRGGNGSMIAHVAALSHEWGDEKTEKWLKTTSKNAGAITKGHTDIVQAVSNGEFEFGLINNYYYHRAVAEGDDKIGFFYPDQGKDGMGAFVNAAGVGIIKGAKNEANAKEFIRYILEDENLKEFTSVTQEVPLNPNVEAVEGAKPISEYKTMKMPLRDIGPVWNDAKQLIEKSGLPLEVQQ
ncbi:MAG TPA: extracellular solute-binding protein [Massilibacterium sp.]|nr:extracellular solute-binding protein [Massilibacterium sp.]